MSAAHEICSAGSVIFASPRDGCQSMCVWRHLPQDLLGAYSGLGNNILQTEMHFPNLRGLPLLKNELLASILINVDLKETGHSNSCAGVIYCRVLRGAEKVVLGLYNQTRSLPPTHRASPTKAERKGSGVIIE